MFLSVSRSGQLGVVGILPFTGATAAVQTLDPCSQDDLKEGDNQAEDQPDVDHLHVRGGGQLLYLAGEDGGHHQHNGQVDSDYISKEVFVKEGGGKCDEEQEDGGEVGGHQLCGHLSSQLYAHVHHIVLLLQCKSQVCYSEHCQVLVFSVQSRKALGPTQLIQHKNLIRNE